MRSIIGWSLVLICCLPVFSALETCATTLIIPSVTAQNGLSFKVPIKIDQIDNLAGIKLIIHYDPTRFTYEDAQKTGHTSSLMHVVNDKTPGTLIIVMAGARGIKGKEIDILSLTFKSNKVEGLKNNEKSQIEILEVQMMDDQLREIKCAVEVHSIVITK